MEDHNSATQIEARSKEVDKLKILKEKLSTVKHKPGFAKVALVRNRNRDGYVESYSALAVFPEGFYVSSGGINSDFHTEQDGREHSIFMTTENACTTHNCDDLYKETPNTSRGVFYLPIKELHESISQLILTNGVAEYSLGRSEQDGTKITQDKENYLLCCLLGGITNETHRIRISDFWRQHSKLA